MSATTATLLGTIFSRLAAHFGPMRWWPGETPFEVMVGAILTQNTNWGNVARAIANLKACGVLDPHVMAALPAAQLAQAIRPAGYFNVKARRLRHFLDYFLATYDGDVARMRAQPLAQLRCELLAVKGIGPETADSILLYALDKPVFVVDAYTHRVMQRHFLSAEETTYDELQALFQDHLPADTTHFNEYHALLVNVGKHFCRPREPKCTQCPLNGLNWRS